MDELSQPVIGDHSKNFSGLPSQPCSRRLDKFTDQITLNLAAFIRPGSGVWDPIRQDLMPNSHYGQSSLALALALKNGTESTTWTDLLESWLSTPPEAIRHEPFNRLLLLLLRNTLDQSDTHAATKLIINSAMPRFPLRGHYSSNNWTLLAALCRILEATSDRERIQRGKKFIELLDRWTTPSGGFIDYPSKPKNSWGATPMAYHHKALFVAVLAAWHMDFPALKSKIQKMLDWVALTWDGATHVGGFGRSTHALYGDACLLASLLLMGFSDERQRHNSGYHIITGILDRLDRQTRVDGLISLNPNIAEDKEAGWDNYMELGVYNAWLAGILTWAQHTNSSAEPASNWLHHLSFSHSQTHLIEDTDAGLLRFESREMVALVSTRGQPPQRFSSTEVEFRYAGGVPFHLVLGGQCLCPPPTRTTADALLRNPALAGWTPIFQTSTGIYGLTDFDTVEISEKNEVLSVHLSGYPVCLLRQPVIGLAQRVLAALDWRLLNGIYGQKKALSRNHIQDLRCTISLNFASKYGKLSHELRIDNRGKEPFMLLNPAGHALMTAATAFTKKLEIISKIQGVPRRIHPYGLDEIRTAQLDSSMPTASGFCLPPQAIDPGKTAFLVRHEWVGNDPEIQPHNSSVIT
ncbi:hypothetical protein [Ectothiorhodospira lacustris]|uniref:hypothetical protein n=1 Tax=Ectothiorhodospira lacustris TaxID=2899127 RepID=UPI001EE7D13C|nr:hypothetical protein [Ectothiorhodospira lacustris]MCG5510350.1 hypothetical protein [Ectothiorhodospira lacustris]MCG5522096.1 hypothetical protein [Ectothiorhodospira lacustris]